MTDIKFEKLLKDLSIANEKYKNLLNKAEDEIKRRYGHYPSDIDNDSWIDTYHVGVGYMSLKEVDLSMKRNF